MRQLSFLLIFLFLFTAVVSAQLNKASQTIGSGTNQLDITVTVNTALSQVKFEITGPASVWFGFSFNTTTMSPGSYTILANVSGGNPAEYIMVNHAAPTLQPVQNLSGFSSSTSAGRKSYVFYRAISTGDANDYTFSTNPGNLDIAWAYGSTLALGYHADRGGSSLTFTNPCSPLPTVALPPVTICAGDSALIFGQYQSVTGQYSQTVSNAWACDTLKTQNLVVVNPVTFQLPAIHICTGDSALIFGQYQTVPGTYNITLQGTNSCDSIVQQPLVVSNGANFYDTLDVYLCEGDTIQLGGLWVNTPGLYTVFNAFQGCDSLYDVFNVMQVTVDTAVSNNSITLQAQSGYDFYTWIDCNSGQPVTSGALASAFTPSAIGSFRVEIVHHGCTLTSGCHVAGPSSVREQLPAAELINLYPNPSSGWVRLEIADPSGAGQIQLNINDINGRVVFSQMLNLTASPFALDLHHLPNGLYLVHLTHQTHPLKAKLLIQR